MPTHGLGDVVATSLFAYALMAVIAMGTAGFVAALVAGLAAIGRRAEAAAARAALAAEGPAAPSPRVAPEVGAGLDPAVVAVIAAAVRAVAGGQRIVYIGETQSMGGWTGEVRQRHHGSHNPHHER